MNYDYLKTERSINMGCDCCKEMYPSDYEICQSRRLNHRGSSPCGHYNFGGEANKGTNYTPPKKKRKKKH